MRRKRVILDSYEEKTETRKKREKAEASDTVKSPGVGELNRLSRGHPIFKVELLLLFWCKFPPLSGFLALSAP